ncbi:MAG: hypothetical protein EU532_13975, partial [Promethearchaeota archaeon]
MRRSIKRRSLIVGMFFLTMIILGLTQNPEFAYAQPQYDEGSKILNVPTSFLISEFSEDSDSEENITSIDLSLPSSNWNLTDLQVNFTDIEFNREILEIESIITGSYWSLGYNFFKALAVQINITEKTLIYGVQIYGFSINERDFEVYIEIRGFDSSKNAPTDEIIYDQTINMSGYGRAWYVQNFQNPVPLDIGNYSLVINATEIMTAPEKTTQYDWNYNAENPMNPDLYSSYYDKNLGLWVDGFRN